MVTEAQRKSSQCLDAALLALGQLAAMTGMRLNAAERGVRAAGKVASPTAPRHLCSCSSSRCPLGSSLAAGSHGRRSEQEDRLVGQESRSSVVEQTWTTHASSPGHS